MTILDIRRAVVDLDFCLTVTIMILYSFVIDVPVAVIYCDEQSECQGQNLIDSTGGIYYHGFDSCTKATTIRTTSNVYAYGAYSAYDAINFTSYSNPHCDGEFSCGNVDDFENYGSALCEGYKSCSATTLKRTESTYSNAYIGFYGYKSGAYSTLNLYQLVNQRFVAMSVITFQQI